MQEIRFEDTGKIKIGGIKLSRELVQYTLYRGVPNPLAWTSMLRKVAENRINLTFLSLSCSTAAFAGSFCVATHDHPRLEALMAQSAFAEHSLEVIAPVGTITVFPHQHSLALLGRVIGILGKARIPMHALCTSLSSLAINTDYRLLKPAVEELQKIFDLPSNHAPFSTESDQQAINR